MRILKELTTLALMGALALTLSGCGGRTTDELGSAVGKSMGAALPTAFKKFKFEERSLSPVPTPTLVFEGKRSAIVAVSKPRVYGYLNPEVVMYGLAVTENGRFFQFSYISALHSAKEVPFPFFPDVPCEEDSCRAIRNAQHISVLQAQNWYFNSESFTPERYKALFKEDAPPQRIDA